MLNISAQTKRYPVRIRQIGFGDAVTDNTLTLMKNIINRSIKDYYVRRWAEKIVEGATREEDQVDAVYHFIYTNSRYLHDPYNLELLKSPEVALQLIEVGERPALDCIPLSEEIIVKNKITDQYELIPIGNLRDLVSRYDALSYNFSKKKFEFKPILKWIDKGNKNILSIVLNNGTSFRCTSNHQLFTLEGQKRKHWKILEKTVDEIDSSRWWKKRILSAYKIPSLGNEFNMDKLWLSGIYVAEGYWQKRNCESPCGQVFIANDSPIVRDEISKRLLNIGTEFYKSKRTKHAYIAIQESNKRRVRNEDGTFGMYHVGSNEFADKLRMMGNNSLAKNFPNEFLSLSEKHIEILLDGYAIGDAYTPRPNTSWYGKVRRIYNTGSEKLSKQLFFLHLILGRPLYFQYQKDHMGVGRNPIWRLYDRICKGEKTTSRELWDGIGINSIHEIKKDGIDHVCDITVKDNHNFILHNGVVVHNCDDLTMLSLSLLKSIGFPVALRATGYNPQEPFTHVYGLVQIYGMWTPIDLVKGNGVGYEHPGIVMIKDVEV